MSSISPKPISAPSNPSWSKTGSPKDSCYKHAFVDFIKGQAWNWFITIPIGQCENDDRVVSDLRKIEAILCGRYVTKRYHKLPDQARYSFLVAFEGERKNGTRHAHLLAYVPKPKRRNISYDMAIDLFTQEFRFLWNQFRPCSRMPFERPGCAGDAISNTLLNRSIDEMMGLRFQRATDTNTIYAVKDVRLNEAPWSRIEFIRPPKSKPFANKNLSVIRNRDKQRRIHLRAQLNDHVV